MVGFEGTERVFDVFPGAFFVRRLFEQRRTAPVTWSAHKLVLAPSWTGRLGVFVEVV